MVAEKLRKIYENAQADALFIECDFLRRYLTGFYSTDGYVLLDDKGCTFVADSRYFEAAEKALKGSPVKVVEGSRALAYSLAEQYKTLGVPFSNVTVAAFHRLKEAGHELVDCEEALNAAMEIKSEEELGFIQKACEIAEDALLALLPELKEGMTENEVAALLEYKMRRLGATGPSFETIVAFGANGSVPHYETGNAKLCFGDAVLIDFGCKVEGYCSDCTRTFLYGDNHKQDEFKKLYAEVLTAHELVKERVVAGMTGREADAIARDYLAKKGLDKLFTHSLGHGIGLQIHEYPYLAPRGEGVLLDGMVFSDEPGVYLPGKLGIRIEDSMYMKDGKTHSFMHKTEKNLLVL